MRNAFCIGPGSLMGTNGFKWAGLDPMDDCSVLWFESWGLTSFKLAGFACFLVFLLAAVLQNLIMVECHQLQKSKMFAKRRLALALDQAVTSSRNREHLDFYDPELGNECERAEEAVVHLKGVGPLHALGSKRITLSTVEHVVHLKVTSVKVDKWTHLCDAVMHGMRILLAYLLMLVVMTYDMTLICSIVGGFMVSYFVFGKETTKVPVTADPCCS